MKEKESWDNDMVGFMHVGWVFLGGFDDLHGFGVFLVYVPNIYDHRIGRMGFRDVKGRIMSLKRNINEHDVFNYHSLYCLLTTGLTSCC